MTKAPRALPSAADDDADEDEANPSDGGLFRAPFALRLTALVATPIL